MRVSTVVAAALVLLQISVARADDPPVTIPTRDVDVTYRSPLPDRTGPAATFEQRMRWAAASGKLRVDPPSPGLHLVMDYATRRLETIRDGERTVLELPASGAGIGPGPGAATTFKRHGEAIVSGLACTEWATRDRAGRETLVCLTADGVMLRAVAGGRVLIEAISVVYGPIDPTAFDIPPDYRRIVPPPVPAEPRP